MNTHFSASEFKLPAGAAPVACVDIGGTKVAVSIADAQGIRGRVAEPTAKEGGTDALGLQIIRLVTQSCQSAGIALSELSAVG
ncbi:MAG: ROK family protein, partial [Rhodoferax sp.]